MIPAVFFLKLSCSSFTIHLSYFIAQQQSIRGLFLVSPYFVFCSISFRCDGLSIERSQKPLTPENTLAVTHHDKQKQIEVKRSSRANQHEIKLFSGCPYYFTLPIRIKEDFTAKLMYLMIKKLHKRTYTARYYINNWMVDMVF